MKHERTDKMNERIARIERVATSLGVTLSSPTKNTREFELSPFKTIRFKCQGKGTMLIEARHAGVLEATNVARDDRVAELLRKAAE
jgi:hypothetical protein